MKIRIKGTPYENAAHWKHEDGGEVEGTGPNMFTGDTIEFNGPSHENGGIPIEFSGKQVEVEGGETAFQDRAGNLNIMGNMNIPGTNIKFKTAGKQIAKQEQKATKQLTQGTDLINGSNPFDMYGVFSFNTGRAKADAAIQKQKALAAEKEQLATVQNMILDIADKTGKDPQQLSKEFKNGGYIAKNGKKESPTIDNIEQEYGTPNPSKYITPISENDDYRTVTEKLASKYGLIPQILVNQFGQESGFKPGLTSSKNAMGIPQFTEDTAKKYGISKAQLKSTKREDVVATIDAAARHMSDLLKENNGDYQLALAEYNGGQRAIDFVKSQLGKKDITGQEWMDFMNKRREAHPTNDKNAWQNQTYDYISNIWPSGANERTINNFRNTYYGTEPVGDVGEMTPINPVKNTLPVEINPQVQPLGNRQLTNTQQPTLNYNPKSPTTSLADRNKLSPFDFAGEIAALGERPDAVPHFQYNPILNVPFQVSFQDRLNENQASFNAFQRTAGNNLSALATLAAQKYNADNQVLADQFRTNQGIQNNVTNQNVGILNQAELTNLQLNQQQADLQARALANTRNRRNQAISSIADKFSANRAQNIDIRLRENMFNYRPNQNMQMIYQGPDAYFNPNGIAVPPTQATTKATYDSKGNLINQQVTTPSQMAVESQYWDNLNKRKAAITNTLKWGGKI